MWYDKLFFDMEKAKDISNSLKMSKYMQNKFYFLGIPRPELNKLIKPYLKESSKFPLDWSFINSCWNKDYREAQYVGLIYLIKNKKYLKRDNLIELKRMITLKSWWDTVDLLDSLVGDIVKKNNELESIMEAWSKEENIWIRRVSINYQLKYKSDTNKEILANNIENNFQSDEFFINKAIGWSLREYSKVNPKWVKEFIELNKEKMNKLSIKVGSRYINFIEK